MIYINPGTNVKYNVLRYGVSAGGNGGDKEWFPLKNAM